MIEKQKLQRIFWVYSERVRRRRSFRGPEKTQTNKKTAHTVCKFSIGWLLERDPGGQIIAQFFITFSFDYFIWDAIK
ncbi:hypothetical protein EUTSA_v10029106mg [Eutrema salsugineum]|uniref:Uncharacterized protein n=1 Tax=Eutrema salsugineum TaxID=72664 RepID=V4L6V8_EUTSA|nr:hypothetical protein EUTSA_v10029106mg [Eutrema salsugineum]